MAHQACNVNQQVLAVVRLVMIAVVHKDKVTILPRVRPYLVKAHRLLYCALVST